jgi:hypothetical protein
VSHANGELCDARLLPALEVKLLEQMSQVMTIQARRKRKRS